MEVLVPVHKAKLHKARATAIVEEIVNRFDLGWMQWVVAFDPKAQDDNRVLCQTICDWYYRQTTLLFNLPTLASTTDAQLRGVVIHEIVHALIAPLFTSLTEAVQERLHDVNELSTENVSRVLEHLLKGEKDVGKIQVTSS